MGKRVEKCLKCKSFEVNLIHFHSFGHNFYRKIVLMQCLQHWKVDFNSFPTVYHMSNSENWVRNSFPTVYHMFTHKQKCDEPSPKSCDSPLCFWSQFLQAECMQRVAFHELRFAFEPKYAFFFVNFILYYFNLPLFN